ncbi:hypothetical protein HD597_000518 [Nonomuraea thailandensis]|uniref:Uncharacterized protein n=1 Tax=Nonomuraea thailandensis TaxID=1188745 RepID=A0A9X2JY72_9ACTN|nr:hypothetical protein [Nonomuraea thailandensis]
MVTSGATSCTCSPRRPSGLRDADGRGDWCRGPEGQPGAFEWRTKTAHVRHVKAQLTPYTHSRSASKVDVLERISTAKPPSPPYAVPAQSRRPRAKTQRLRLNRGGDRQANAALYRIALSRLRWDQRTCAYLERRLTGDKTAARSSAASNGTSSASAPPRTPPCPFRPVRGGLTSMGASTASTTPRPSPPTWPSTSPWSCCSEPATARTTTQWNASGPRSRRSSPIPRQLARPSPTDPRILPYPITRSDAHRRRALDQPLAACGLQAEFLECRLSWDVGGDIPVGRLG